VLQLLESPDSSELAVVAFSFQETIPMTEGEVASLVDVAVGSLLGPAGFMALLSPGDRVVIKVNTVEPDFGAAGEKGYAIITDPRVLRAVAARVRAAIGDEPPARILVADACFDDTNQPPACNRFYRCRLDIEKDGIVDIRYDGNNDGILDGGSGATLVNTDAIPPGDCFTTDVGEPLSGSIPIVLPKFLRTREQAIAAGEPDEYCDVLINLPVFKNHQGAGMTVSIKNYYGFAGFAGYAPLGWDRSLHAWGGSYAFNRDFLDEFLVAQSRARPSDLIIADTLTGNRSGPANFYRSVHDPVDYITPNAIFAATDQVAVDTVLTLLAGYRPESVAMLGLGHMDGLGIGDPGCIHVKGFDAFTSFRNALAVRFPLKYPFPDPFPPPESSMPPDGVAGFTDFTPPAGVSISEPQSVSGTVYAFPYTAEDTDSGLVRIELVIDGALATFKTSDLESPQTIQYDLAAYAGPVWHEARVAAWDRRLNCTLSPPVMFFVETPVSAWRVY